MQAITCVISQYVENSSIVYVVEILRLCEGSHLIQGVHPDSRYTDIYINLDSYDPLAQVRDWTTEDGESRQQTHYFHCDQIGIPREMTGKDGNLLWFGEYIAWKNHYKCKSYLT